MRSPAIAVSIGVDVGTGGVRALAAAARGLVVAEAQLALSGRRGDPIIHEQDPAEWWGAVCSTVKDLGKDLNKVASLEAVEGIAVTSTSGSLVLADAAGQPVRLAILYDDTRGASIAEELNRRMAPEVAQFNASHSLVKAAWVRQEEPEAWARTCHVLHPADWLTGKLTGQFGSSDESNALKLGYDADAGGWSGAVSRVGIPRGILPRVVRPGTQVGTLCASASQATGLRRGTPVFAGTTDGMSALIASGARQPGQANTTLGTTIVWKVLSKNKVPPSSGIYCHRHPIGLWAPGAASNSGPGGILPPRLGAASADLDRRAAQYLPTATLCYPLRSKGERFPFLNPQAEGFLECDVTDSLESYAAQLQSLALVERWGYERLEECGAAAGNKVFTTGSAATSAILMQLRASVLKREVYRCRHPTSAFGAAILAACTPLYGGDLISAIRGMTRVSERFQPERPRVDQYDEIYSSFLGTCARRGYA